MKKSETKQLLDALAEVSLAVEGQAMILAMTGQLITPQLRDAANQANKLVFQYEVG